jgi:hypothetical protein
MTYKPSGILTFTTHSGKTHLELEQDYSIEQKRRLMEFMISPAVKEITKKIGEDLMAEYNKVNHNA